MHKKKFKDHLKNANVFARLFVVECDITLLD